MNSPRHAIILYSRFTFALLAFVLSIGLLMKTASNSARARGYEMMTAQNDEKSLNIERYPNEPVELVDITIREISVKEKIKTKLRDARNRPVLDRVSFKEHNDWFKHVRIRLRNVSNRSICGLEVNLYFQPAEIRWVFSMDLKPRSARSLFKQPLASGEEIDLEISEDSMNQAVQRMFQNGVDLDQSKAYLSVHTVYFSEDFGSGQGSFMRRDPYNPNNWQAVDTPEGGCWDWMS